MALYDFEQNEPDDLPFKAGETIQLLSCPENEEWWQGQKDGKVGIFPKAYVAKQPSGGAPAAPPAGVDQPASAAAPMPPIAPMSSPAASNPFGEEGASNGVAASPVAAPPAAPAPGEASPAVGGEASPAGEQPKLLDATCTALFDFEGQDDDELSFKVGQQLVITGELNGWYLGRVQGSERTGIFPSNHVQIEQ